MVIKKRLIRTAAGVATACLAIGCGGSSQMAPEEADARASVLAAETVGAEGTPGASLHLELAREQIARAGELAEDGKSEAAQRMLARAELDAELAIALADQAQMREEAQEARDRIRTLQEQNNL